jgi:hypothetical protein
MLKRKLTQFCFVRYFSSKKNIKVYFLLSLPFLVQFSCNTTEPPIIPPPPPVVKDTITVSVESFTHRSITLNVNSTANSKNSSIRLIRELNGVLTTVTEYSILVKDTTIIDDDNGTGLLLDTAYTYFAVRVDSLGQLKDTSNIVTQKTLAPTSHNYTWQEFTIGDAGFSNTLYDVWGTDENNVWAVGDLRINGKFFGTLQWNGLEWTPDSTVGGSAIFGFTENDIWIVGGGVYHLENGKWVQKDFRLNNGHVIILDSVLFSNRPYTSIWGTSSNNLYLGNIWGKIIHWDGSKASITSSNFNNPFNDMDGYSGNYIIAVGTDLTPPSSTVYYDGNDWSIYNYTNNIFSLNSVSIVIPNYIYWGGEGIFETRNGSFSKIVNTGYYVWDIEYNRTTGEIVAAGDVDGLHIYDGIGWTSFKGIVSNDGTTYNGIYLINKTILCVGRNNDQAKIVIGKR